MTRRRRYRINISLDEETYNWVRRITEAQGEDSTPSGTVGGMVRLLRNMQRECVLATPDQPSSYGEIGDIFASYAYVEAEPGSRGVQSMIPKNPKR